MLVFGAKCSTNTVGDAFFKPHTTNTKRKAGAARLRAKREGHLIDVAHPERGTLLQSSLQTMSKKKNQLADDLISSIDDEAMLDIMLVAKDGGEIPASRFVLGARSTVLQKMLFSEGQIGGSPELKLDYSSKVVRTLVHYCRTNELNQDWQSKDEVGARELVNLCNCACCFQLEGLTELVCDLASSLTKTHPHLACAIYDEAAAHGEVVDIIKFIARYAIRQNPEAALLRRNEFGNRDPGISSLGPTVVEEIISDPRMCTEEINMFRAVALWADARNYADGVNNDSLDDSFNSATYLKERRALAKQITARCIDLSKIAPSELLGFVSDSGLVDTMSVSNALIQLALRIEKEGAVVSKPRALVGQVPPPSCKRPPRSARGRLTTKQEEEEENSIADEPDDFAEVSSYDTAPINNKKRIKKLPAMVTPQKTQKPRAASTPTNMMHGNGPQSRRLSIREAMGHFLAEKVDTMCLHPSDVAKK